MNKRTWMQLIANLGDEFDDFILRPDHPFVFRGPDVLIRVGQKLGALYIASDAEQKFKPLLLHRLAASRLAYPHNTIHILFADHELHSARLSPVSLHFDHFFDISESRGLRRFLAGFDLRRLPDVPAKIRSTAFNSAHLASIRTDLVHWKLDGGPDPSEVFHQVLSVLADWMPDYQSEHQEQALKSQIPARLQIRGEYGFSWESLHLRRGSSWPVLWRRAAEALTATANLDKGIPYPTKTKRIFLLLDEIPNIRVDPMFVLRSLGFLGLHIIPIREIKELAFEIILSTMLYDIESKGHDE